MAVASRASLPGSSAWPGTQPIFLLYAGGPLARDSPAILIEAFRGISQSLDANAKIVLRLGHDHFFLNPFKFISHPTI
jgi:hypothetical protein